MTSAIAAHTLKDDGSLSHRPAGHPFPGRFPTSGNDHEYAIAMDNEQAIAHNAKHC